MYYFWQNIFFFEFLNFVFFKNEENLDIIDFVLVYEKDNKQKDIISNYLYNLIVNGLEIQEKVN